ncbi:MAG: addiction module protein [Planctomycetota bacterium]|nr:addiction module protein [Planctomycetaceae bacterium]MDQ3330534.1 addiction module protein [Planctomycetota bacterium]
MSQSLQSLGIDRLSVEERIALVEMIWESIDAEQPSPRLSAEDQRELKKRVADHEANPHATVPWKDVKNEALKRFES